MMRQTRYGLHLLAAAALAAGLAAGAARAEVRVPIEACTTIDQPGSYILTRNITASGDCIVVNADHVTLDLNGFALLGDRTGIGITDNSSIGGLTVRNGTVANFFRGITIRETSRCYLQDLRVFDSTNEGVSADGACIIFGNIFAENGGSGLQAKNALVSGNISRGNDSIGIDASGVLTRNVASGNVIGILALISLTTGNAVHGHEFGGILPGSDFAVTNNAVTVNVTGLEYRADSGGLVIYNTSRSNPGGNQVGVCGTCTIVHNRF